MTSRFEFRSFEKVVLPDELIVNAVTAYVCVQRAEGRAVYDEARGGNKIAEYIVGMALLKAEYSEFGQAWLKLSADLGFEPAAQELLRLVG